MSLASLAERAVHAALRAGAEEAEAYAWESRDLQASALGGSVAAKESRTSGIGVRALRRGALGFAAAAPAASGQAERAAQRAARLAALLPPSGATLPEPVKRAAARGPRYDASLAALEPAQAARIAERALREAARAGRKGRIAFASATLARSSYRFAVRSSRGVEAQDRGVRASLEVEVRVRSGQEERTGRSVRSARVGFEAQGAGREARERAEAMLGAKRLGKGVLPVVLGHDAAVLLPILMGFALAGPYVAQGRSVLAGKVGQKVASRALTVRDGPGLGGLAAQRWDDEGTPARDRALVERGALRGYLLDHASAAKLGLPRTGNALRGAEERFRFPPSAQPMGLAIDAGRGTPEELASELDRGVLVRWELLGLTSLNHHTGDFSIVAPAAFLVRRGSVAHPLRPTTIAGNLLTLLRSVERVGAYDPARPGMRLPSLLVGGLTCAT